jgi:hypothetical protein
MSEEPNSENRKTVSKTFSIKYAISRRISWQSIKDWIISFATTILVASIIISLIIISLSVLSSFLTDYFPKEVGKSLVVDILKSIIQIDGILIGFNGVVYAQLLWSVNSLQNTISQRFFEIGKRASKDKMSMVKGLKALRSQRRSLVLALLFVTILYLGSIYYALAHVAWTEKWTTDTIPILPFVYVPTLLLFSATIISMVIASTRELTIIEAEDEQKVQ